MNKYQHTQIAFRSLLHATNYPGRKTTILDNSSISESLKTIAQCLLDHEIKVSIYGEEDECLQNELLRLTHCEFVQIEKADFVFFLQPEINALEIMQHGNMKSPEFGATAIFVESSLINNHSENNSKVKVDGPGIKTKMDLPTGKFPVSIFKKLQEINSGFPLGIDSNFIYEDGEIMALPRSTRISFEN